MTCITDTMTVNPPEQKPVRRMSDLGPRRSMDMGRRAPQRPVAAPDPAPAPQAPVQPQPQPRPVVRPQAAPARRPAPQPQPQPQPAARPRPAAPRHQALADEPVPAASAPTASKARGGWWTALQFIIGLLVIVGVAAAIIALYMRYYQ